MAATDATLVLGVLSGDRAAFAELYDRRARLIRAICFDTTRDIHSAADLTQEVFLRAYCGLGNLRDPQRFSPWLSGIARQVCREWKRGRLRERRWLQAVAREPGGRLAGGAVGQGDQGTLDQAADPPSGQAAEMPDDGLLRLREAIATLPEKERVALHAFYLQLQDVEQARTVLGLSRSGFYRVLSLARQRLKRILSRSELAR